MKREKNKTGKNSTNNKAVDHNDYRYEVIEILKNQKPAEVRKNSDTNLFRIQFYGVERD